LLIAKPDATEAELVAALDRLGLRERFEALPEGLDTEVRERGSRLSAGERQLVALSRAALVDPAVLVLDEATSNLDPGTEMLIEFSPTKAFASTPKKTNLLLFVSAGLIDARYDQVKVIARQGNNLVESSLKNNRVENAPREILRSGITLTGKKFTATVQYNYVGQAFSDANNSLTPNATGINGLIPSYQLVDLAGTWKFSEQFFIKGGLNNLFNEAYFTRRAGGYPGPGLMTAEPRNFFITIGAKL
jgi:Fe(3+) dicitrate transport protein